MELCEEELNKYAQASLDTTQFFLNLCGPRLAGSEGSKKAAELFYHTIQNTCDTAKIEEFEVHPEAFIGFMKFISISHIIASIFLILTILWDYFIYFALTVLIVALIDGVTQFVFYLHFFDKFYKKKTGYNAFGILKPSEEIKQRIIFAGHHDSVHIFNFLESKYQKYYSARIMLGIFSILITLFLTLYWSIFYAMTDAIPLTRNFTIIFAFLGYIFVIPLYFFVNKKVNLGAGDNMIASSIVLKLAELFHILKSKNISFLKNTELIFVSFDGEESGMVGSRHFAQTHKKDLLKIPTFVFNLDCIYEIDNLQFLTRDINGFQKLSRNMANDCKNMAEKLGYSSSLFPFTFGGGGTDAAEFARIGVETTTLLAMATTWVRDGLKYHTSRDLVEGIDLNAVAACIDIAFNYALNKDKNLQQSSKNHSL